MRLLILALGILVGCGPGGASRPHPSVDAPLVEKKAPVPAAEKPFEHLDVALIRAAAFLEGRADKEGVWRSKVYPPFRDGASLTPLCLRALDGLDLKSSGAARKRGADFLDRLVVDGAIQNGDDGISYPVYTSAGAILVDRRKRADTLKAWQDHLLAHQLTEKLGWEADDPRHGGWSYAHEPPSKPPAGSVVPILSEPNLSATVFALDALRAAQLPRDHQALARARLFVERMQNLHSDEKARDPLLDDGGFFFVLDDPVRNKAGVVKGADPARFASYGSTTADGLRALLACGLAPDHPRVTAARTWLERNFRADSHPGRYAGDREFARESLYYYYAASVALSFELVGVREIDSSAGKLAWADALSKALLARQREDGSWRNEAVDVREDDPLVATPLAMIALAACRRVLARP